MTLAQAATVSAIAGAKGVRTGAKVGAGVVAIVFLGCLEGWQLGREGWRWVKRRKQ